MMITSFLIISGCNNDDDNNTTVQQNSFLKIGDNEYELKAGLIEDYGLYEPGLYNFDITLISSNVVEVDGEPFPEDQIVNAIYFELFTDSQTDLSTGVYSLVDFQNIGNQTFELCEISENVDVNSVEETGTFTGLVSGTLEVVANGPEYEFQFSGVDNLGQDISGSYQGNLNSVLIE